MAKKKQTKKPNWRKYEEQMLKCFHRKYPESQILYDQKLMGHYSQVNRQIDILVRHNVNGEEKLGVFDCKCVGGKKPSVDVKLIDSMIGYIEDIGADFGGVIATIPFSKGANNRVKNIRPEIDLRTVPFKSPCNAVNFFGPSLDFSDSWNSQYLGVI
jgi:hypothetical protein